MNSLDDEGAIALLVGALERPSPSGEEAVVAAYLRDALAPFAADATLDEVGNVIASVGRGARRVVLLGHLDTVPGWPSVRRTDGVVLGRGAVDAKGPLCAMASALTRLSARARERLTVVLVGAVEEEAPTSRGARHAVATLAPPDLVVIGEPSGWDGVTLGYKGRVVVRLAASKGVAHSARAEATALEAVVDGWSAVRAWARSRSTAAAGAFDSVQATLLDVDAHDDALLAFASARIGLRLPTTCTPAEAELELRHAIADVASSTGVGIEVHVAAGEAAYRGPRDTPLTRAFRSAIRATGGTPRLTLKTGTSDMNVVAPAWPVPIVAYGPGDAALDHTPAEHVQEWEYLRGIDVLTLALERLAT
ncbi:MAG: [LysW]-lysine hydrolase [Trueperaceae bacterium]|nr:[LysW]-lysine hydrolase [Trueperaceae bacterium]